MRFHDCLLVKQKLIAGSKKNLAWKITLITLRWPPHLKVNLINGLLRIHNCKHKFFKTNKTSLNENDQLQRAKAHVKLNIIMWIVSLKMPFKNSKSFIWLHQEKWVRETLSALIFNIKVINLFIIHHPAQTTQLSFSVSRVENNIWNLRSTWLVADDLKVNRNMQQPSNHTTTKATILKEISKDEWYENWKITWARASRLIDIRKLKTNTCCRFSQYSFHFFWSIHSNVVREQ